MQSEFQTLGEFVSLISGNTPSKANSSYWGEETPWVSAKDMGDFWIEDAEDHLSAAGLAVASRLVPAGTVLLLTRGMTLHKRVPICRVAKPSTFNQDVKAVLPKRGLSPRFLPYLLVGNHDRLHERVDSAGHGTGRLNTDALLSLPVYVPSEQEQERIADFGEAIDARLRLLRQANNTLESIARALFKSWFIDFDPVHAKASGREPDGMNAETAAFFPSAFEKSTLGLVPVGWRPKTIEELASKVGMGPFGSNIKVSTFVESGVPVLNGSCLKDILLEEVDWKFITDQHAERLSSALVGAGDIVITHRGTLGQVSLIPSDSGFQNYMLSQSQFFLRTNPDATTSEFMSYFLKSDTGQHLLLANAAQVGVPSISRPVTYLKSIRLAVPTIQVARAFTDMVEPLHRRIVLGRNQIRLFTKLRNGVIPRLISGSLRLPEAEAQLDEAIA